ncbi:capsule assembly Wzi family protein [Parashewanella spongiae]|uniref:Capsule assembly Wzi family protein n=1 Tax=Parashewanella spongiae TaxID=342950 RepID=A0A3A6U440_9GAMM|nr:capsule assembly Wzi family protein [Parashewanella spongiae]MCL1077131.1 capsule assembly Wzi family protein [Parashewanella spongiae]RJY18846.1 capsule assembly Wzi family protein [Parashewanella spongiae]
MKTIKLMITSLLIIAPCLIKAAPWIDSSDIYLRADIQALADEGIITVPINTFPLMWSGIRDDLSNIDPTELTPELNTIFSRVNYRYKSAVNDRYNKRIKLSGASDEARFRHFGSDYREQGEVTASYESSSQYTAFKLSSSASYQPEDNKSLRFDDSYFALKLGNWVASVGTLEQWWGPGFDSSLHKSTNARPLPSIALTRDNSQAFETPLLSWVGPWTLTTGFSLFEKERFAPNALLWNFRGTIKPLTQLEIGFSWTMQFCGEGQECDWKTWAKSVTGQKDCRNDTGGGCTNFGNQMAGFDLRYADTWYNIPIGIYAEKTCEDSSGSSPLDIADCGYLFGLDSRFSFDDSQYKIFLEYTDTVVSCGVGDEYFNCFYEHSTYRSGSRYYQRSLGSTYDSDAKVYVIGLIGQIGKNRGLTSLLRYAQLNKDGVEVRNGWAPITPKEDLLQLELSYRQPFLKGMVTLGGTLSQSKFVETKDDIKATIHSNYEYRF